MKTLFGTEFNVTILRIDDPDGPIDQHTIEFKKNEQGVDYWKRCCHLFIEGLGDNASLKLDVMNLIHLWYCMFKAKEVENFDELAILYNQVISSDEYTQLKNTKFDKVEDILFPTLGHVDDIVDAIKKKGN